MISTRVFGFIAFLFCSHPVFGTCNLIKFEFTWKNLTLGAKAFSNKGEFITLSLRKKDIPS